MKLVLVDYFNFLYSCWHSANFQIKKEKGHEITKEDVPFFIHVFFNSFNKVISTYGKIILCSEGVNSIGWRRSIFPGYKQNREELKKEESYLLLKEAAKIIFPALQYYPITFLSVPNAEADDVIYTISMLEKENDILIISSDKDLSQIMNYRDGVTQYSYIRDKFVEPNKYIVEEKAIVGDPSDGIPGLHRVGDKTFKKMLEDQTLWNEKMKGGNKEIYEMFLKIIDFRNMPKNIFDSIKNAYLPVQGKYNSFLPEDIELYYWDQNLPDLMSRWTHVKEEIRRAIREEKIELTETKLEFNLEW